MNPAEEIFEAVKAADPDRVEALLARDPTLVNARNAGGLTPVVVATYYGRKEMVARDASGSTPLSLAEHEGSREIVELLLARGAASTPDATKSRA